MKSDHALRDWALRLIAWSLAAVLAAAFAAALMQIHVHGPAPEPTPEGALGGSITLWVGLAALSLALAGLVLAARPRHRVHWLLALWFAAHGIATPWRELLAQYPGLPHWGLQWGAANLVEAAAFVPLVLIPLVYPLRRLPPLAERILAAVLVLLLAAWWYAMGDHTLTLRGYPVHQALAAVAGLIAHVGILLGCILFARLHTQGDAATERHQAIYFLGAYIVTAATFAVATDPVRLARFDPLLGLDGPATVLALAGMLLSVLAVVFVLVALLLAHVPRRAKRLESRPGETVVVLALVVVGLAHPLLGIASILVWLFVRPLLFAYGILGGRLLDVDVARRAPLLIIVALLAGVTVVYLATEEVFLARGTDASAAGALSTVAALALVVIFAWPIVTRIARDSSARGWGARGEATYRSVLEEAILHRNDPADDAILKALRGRLGVSERQHALMELELRSAHGQYDATASTPLLGRYRVEALLGEGGFARTYRATDERLDRKVVLKVFRWSSKRDAERALQEARILARLDHPTLVTIHDVEEIGDELVLILEHVPGGSLADELARGALAPERAFNLMDDVLAGLTAAHREGVVHRDLKPANVLLANGGRAKLADFGIARQEEQGTLTSMEGQQTGPGTVRYMSPEQARGNRVDARSDVYSAGVLLVEMLTRRSYLGLAELPQFEARLAIIEREPPFPLPGVPAAIDPVLRRALAKDPAERYADAAELRNALRRARPAKAEPEDAD